MRTRNLFCAFKILECSTGTAHSPCTHNASNAWPPLLVRYLEGFVVLLPAVSGPTDFCLLNLRVLAMLLLIAIAFLLKRYGTQAIPLPAPFPASASFEAPIFARDNPSDGCNSRTVLDILWSCLATTFACTWVSVHPNVPFKGEGKWTLLRRRIFLMFFSILAPEFMIMWAFKQWRGAVMIREALNSAFPASDKPWTTTHGHFLQMGGFQLHTTVRENMFAKKSTALHRRSYSSLIPDHFMCRPDDNDTIKQKILEQLRELTGVRYPDKISEEDAAQFDFWDGIWEGVLTFDALKQLLSENLITFPTIIEDEINDKSKGDALSKGIALLQLSWFIVQILTRAVQGLAITELELTTAALAGLNSVMYIFWWSKPRDVRFPVVIRTKGVEAQLAKRLREDVEWSFLDQEFDIRKHLWASMTSWIKALFVVSGYFVVSLPFRLISTLLESVETAKTFPRRFSFFFSRPRTLLSRSRKPTTSANESEMLLAVDDEPPRKSENHTKRYASLLVDSAKSATKSAFLPFLGLIYIIDVVLFIPIAKILRSDVDNSISGVFLDEVGGFNVNTESKMFSMIFYSEDAGVKPLLTTSAIAGALFGAVHCLAWHFSFPSHAEQILWRAASLGIVGSCVVTFLTVLCFDFIYRHDDLLGLLCLAPSGLASFVYPVARITLLVLAITSLRSLSPSALDTVDWVEFFPHI